jgi:intraflagellar transport protein 172
MMSMAFMCWNRYLDLSEAIEDGNSAATTADSDFSIADHPKVLSLPSENLPVLLLEIFLYYYYLLQEEKREQVRDWILSVSLDQKVRHELDKRNCEQCQASIYGPSLICQQCSKNYQQCIVTGYPVLVDKISCQSCQKLSNREDWNAYVFLEKSCPWCGAQQTPNYAMN